MINVVNKKNDSDKSKIVGGKLVLFTGLIFLLGVTSFPANADTKWMYYYSDGTSFALPRQYQYIYDSAEAAGQAGGAAWCEAFPSAKSCRYEGLDGSGIRMSWLIKVWWINGYRDFRTYLEDSAVFFRTCTNSFVQPNGSCGPNPQQSSAEAKAKQAKKLGSSCDGASTQAGDPGTCTSDPINQSTGNVIETQVDYRAGGADPLSIVRYYNSQAATTGVFGANWSSVYDANITQLSSTQEWVTLPDGRGLIFTQSNGAWTADGDVNGHLMKTASGWAYTAHDDTIDTYNTDGKLISITRPGGLTQILTYDSAGHIASVTGPFGRMLTITVNSSGQISAITDPSGAVYQYAYDTNHNLISVTYPDSTTKHYLYENSAFPHALTGLVDENGVRYTTWTYDSAGRATSSAHANNTDLFSIQYQLDANNAITSSTVSQPLGAVQTYTYQAINGLSHTSNETRSTATGTVSRTWTYDDHGNAVRHTDYNGNTGTASYDATRNLPLTQTDASGRTVTTQWDANFRLPDRVTVSDNAGHSRATAYTYDSAGQVLTKTVSDPATGTSRTWTYTYNAQGLLASVDGPRTDVSDVTAYGYDAQGNLTQVTNALGQTTHITAYDANGRPLRLSDPNGLVTQLAYDGRGRLSSQTVGSELTTYQYDSVGNLTKLTRPDSSYLTYTYDAAHRLTEVDDSLGNRLVYTLDAAGNHTQIQTYDPNGTLRSTRQQVYDQLNQLAQVIGAQDQTTAYAYDANGNRTGMTDARGNTTSYAYDGVNRLIQQVDAQGGHAAQTYDTFNDVTAVTDPNGLTTTYTYDNLGDKLSQTSPDTGTTSYTYDSAGHVATKTDARGDTTTYTYDALNRVTTATFADGTQTTYQYDQGVNGIGHLTQMTDPSGTTRWTYDEYGHVLTKTQQTGNVTLTLSMTYNAAGQRTSLTYPGGDIVGYSYDQGRVSGLTLNGQTLLANITYQPLGPVTRWTWGNGQTETRQYNLDSQLSAYAMPNGTRTLSYDPVGNITSITGQRLKQTFGYDALNRLTAANDTSFNQSYRYDANSNRLSMTDSGHTTNYAYATDSNRLLNLSGTTTQTNQYDANGNLIDDGIHRYRYDARNQLVSVDGGKTATYRYNALGQRVQKRAHRQGHRHHGDDRPERERHHWQRGDDADEREASHECRHHGHRPGYHHGERHDRLDWLFAYDTHGNLLGQYDRCGDPDQEIIRLGRLPVAVVRHGRVYAIYTDQLGAPRALTNRKGRVVWHWNPSPFGDVTRRKDDEDAVTFSFNLRFPGQYYDAETGLNYNDFRYYDPSTGRYITSDPIGLRGGLNTYGYVGGKPISRIDPMGLDWIYHQSTGKLYHEPPAKLGGGPPAYVGKGYAGIGTGLNNPAMQNVPNIGPLPQGTYTIGAQANHGKGGKLKMSMILTPDPTNQMFGRFGFLMHGPHPNDHFNSSNGCPVMKKSIRDQVAHSGDNILKVVP